MKRNVLDTFIGIIAICIFIAPGTASASRQEASQQREASQQKNGAEASEPVSALTSEALHVVEDYCVMCHNDAAMTGNLSLETFDTSHPEQNAEIAEKMIRKLRLGMMPPSYASQPEPETVKELVRIMETRIDELYADDPFPGRRTFQRLNRAEYALSIEALLDLDVDVSAFLPPDTISDSFDNVADVQAMSPTLMDGYLRAANSISRLAVGDPSASATEVTYKTSRLESQMQHVEGAPMGTRGGVSVIHTFPADGDYIFKIQLHGTPTGQLFGLTAGDSEQIEVSINGARVALLDIDRFMDEVDENGLVMMTEPIAVKAGPHRVSAAFIQRFQGPVDDLIAPIEHTLTDTTVGDAYGLTTLPHVRFFSINGPHDVTGVSDTPSRRRIFTCRPLSPSEEIPCATEIISRLATQAYRRPVSDSDLEGLLSFYQMGKDEEGNFEAGIRTALQAILVSPHFVFRLERQPDAEAAVASGNVRIDDLELASRLSFFLWAGPPDEELRALGMEGRLSEPEILEAQIDRMLDDPRSSTLATRFASLWLRMSDVEKLHPDALLYPQYDTKLAEALVRETQLFFDFLVRENRSVLELLTADYTFANERVAEHYGIPNIVGDRFRRVSLAETERRGLLGQGSILTLTSVADRTSPVQRGKYVMEVFLGSPPPPPPPNIPDLEATAEAAEGRVLTVREAMEMHRANPACNSCHRVMDPLGLALENFDVTGAWRIKDNGMPIDASGELYDGTPIDGPADLQNALLGRADVIITNFTENLMTYALGRRVEYYDMPAVREIVREAEAKDYEIRAFIKGVVGSTAFQMTRPASTTATEEAQ